jgi:uncharacterized protein (DUF302 family)
MALNYCRNLRLPFDEVVELVLDNLHVQGFNVVHDIDMKDDLRQNLHVPFRNYKILTACHTLLSYKAISLEPHIGTLLPCNVLIQERENGTVEVTAVNLLESLDKNMATTSLEDVATEISDRLRTAVDSLAVRTERFSFSY